MEFRELVGKASGLQYDSRLVTRGEVFFARTGTEVNGNDFIWDVAEQGALGVVSEQERPDDWELAWVQVEDVKQAMAEAGREFYGNPDRVLRVVGVTGTNGKTTVVGMLKYALEQLGEKVGLMGTLGCDLGSGMTDSGLTTPESLDVFRNMREMLDNGCSICVMEVSSIGLVEKRVYGVEYDVAALTNVSPDHLDYHGTMEAYRDAKEMLFDGRNGVTPKYSVRQGRQGVDINTKLLGAYNKENLLMALEVMCLLGYNEAEVVQVLEGFTGVRGRLERVDVGQGFDVVVDFAHTEDALENVLKAVKDAVKGRLIVVFGCGGDRDKEKRAPMTKIALALGDIVYGTSDNPRSEEIEGIFNDMRQGGDLECISDRREAIRRAISEASEGDCVLIAGKGHEVYQEIKGEKFAFDDRQVALEFLGYEEADI